MATFEFPPSPSSQSSPRPYSNLYPHSQQLEQEQEQEQQPSSPSTRELHSPPATPYPQKTVLPRKSQLHRATSVGSSPAAAAATTATSTAGSSASLSPIADPGGGQRNVHARTQPSTASTSTTSMSGLLGFGAGLNMTAPSTAAPVTAPAALPAGPGAAPITTGTPQTGASKMAAAAAANRRGVEGAEGVRRELRWPDDEHPLSDRSLLARGYHTLHTLSHPFHVPSRWKLLRPLGQGAYGLVISVQDDLSGEPVAVKCITRVFDKAILARRALREITLLRHFGEHENLTGLIDLDHVWDGYNEIYLYMEPMEADLHQIVRSGQPLSNLHIQFFLYQLLRGMKYIHSANVIHRDLKPGNLLVNSDCELKICDFGLARGFKPVSAGGDELRLTEYVATRWYRAPEIMLSNRRYTTAIDVWSIGCILGELLGSKPLFKGKDYVDQLNLILAVLGTPDDKTLDRVGSEKACAYIRTLPYSERVPFEKILPEADADAVDLMEQLLVFDPAGRINVVQALDHPYVGAYHDPSDEPECHAVFDKWEAVEALETVEELRDAISREISEYRAEVRGQGPDDDDEEEGLDDGYEDDDTAGESGWSLAPSAMSVSPIPSAQVSPNTIMRALSPERARGGGAELGLVPSPRAAVSGLPNVRGIRRSRDTSPATPATAVSDESFGHAPVSARGSGSRRSSTHSVHRRSTSFLFGTGMTPMLAMTSAAPAPGQPPAGSLVDGMSGRKSRAPSSTGVDIGSLRPLIRQLSTTNLEDLRGANNDTSGDEVPPMTVSPSDAPPSEAPKSFAPKEQS